MNEQNEERELREYFARVATPEPSMRLRQAVAEARTAAPAGRRFLRSPRTAFQLVGLAACVVLAAGLLIVVANRPQQASPASSGPIVGSAAITNAPTPISAGPGISPTGSMAASRVEEAAIRLADGRVLFAGGVPELKESVGTQNAGASVGGCGILASAELYDPASGTFSLTGSMATARMQPSAMLLADGRVLVVGGFGCTSDNKMGPQLATAELYDPRTGTFSPTGSMTSARAGYTATLLADGRVLIAGGAVLPNSAIVASAELYDPARGTFSPTGPMTTPRAQQTATLLSSGLVLVAGGFKRSPDGTTSDMYLASAELYDPATGTFSATGSMGSSRAGDIATTLPRNRVLLAGGLGLSPAAQSATNLASAETYDAATGAFTPTAPMSWPFSDLRAAVLPGGRIFIWGLRVVQDGTSLNAAEFYDPTSGTFTVAQAFNPTTAEYAPVLLTDGRLLMAGGWYLAPLSATPTTGVVIPSPGGARVQKFVSTAELYQP
ncbi:MAG TPA: kelch repeat-containing protein [Terriglobales bacterium]|nr:kelch repeat-containing protein [Terriglobales bacterium]